MTEGVSEPARARRHGFAAVVTRVIVCLGVGLALTVASAWIAAAYAPHPATLDDAERTAYQLRPQRVPADLLRVLPETPGFSYEAGETAYRGRGWGLVRDQIHVRVVMHKDGQEFRTSGEDSGVDVSRYSSGWPLAALDWADPQFDSDSVRPPGFTVRTRLERAWEFGIDAGLASRPATGPVVGDWRRLPIRVGDGGVALAIDAVVWALLAAPVLAIPGVIRRWRRQRRGQCVECGYSVRDGEGGLMPRCPECGIRVRAKGAEVGSAA